MSKKTIKYIAFYSNIEDVQNRQSSLSATNKIDYICDALVKNNCEVEIVSPSWSNNISGFYKGSISDISDSIKLRTFTTFGCKNKILRIIKYIFSLSQLFFYLLCNTEKDETVIVYHSVILSLPIRIARFLKRFELILEVEEVYQDIQNLSNFMRRNEYKAFGAADKFLFSTEFLNEKINRLKKPNTIIYGAYNVEKEIVCSKKRDEIHVVYAGTFDPKKGGAMAAVAASEFLTKDYHVHIIGFGSESDTKSLLDKIEEVSNNTFATVTYDGLLRGEEYKKLLQLCDIGLSTQTPDGVYNETSFPSKILSYMANGLRVVSVRIKAIDRSMLGKEVYYYDDPTPESIANAIMAVDINEPYDSRKTIKRLHEDFSKSIYELLRC